MSLSVRVNPDLAPKTVPLLRGQPRSDGATGPGIRLAALRVPLAVKLLGANLLVVTILGAAWWASGHPAHELVFVVAGIVILLHLALVLVALRPIRDLEIVASRVWHGDYGARVERSRVADHEVLRVGSMFNILLDGLASDRARMRALATDIIAAGDKERAALAHELHDSTAQQVAALLLELSVAAREANDPDLAERLRRTRDAAETILEEVRVLSETVHPAVLDDLGLIAALRKLSRDSSNGNGIDIDVNADAANTDRLPRNVESVLYRVAQEAVRNATRHASPRRVRLTLYTQPRSATLEVHDDGRGFNPADVDQGYHGRGLSSMRERVALVDGWLEVKTAPGSGTTVSATVPLDSTPDDLP